MQGGQIEGMNRTGGQRAIYLRPFMLQHVVCVYKTFPFRHFGKNKISNKEKIGFYLQFKIP